MISGSSPASPTAIAVMYAGRIVEIGPTDDVLDHPIHPYTIGLLQSVPANVPRGAPLLAIPGMAPPPLQPPLWLSRSARAALSPPRSARPSRRLDAPGTVAWRCFHPQARRAA